jgi:hypothetical protein
MGPSGFEIPPRPGAREGRKYKEKKPVLLYVKKQDETTTKFIIELERKRSFNGGKRVEDDVNDVNESETFRYTTDAVCSFSAGSY